DLVNPPCERRRDSVAAQKDRQLAKSGRIVPGRRDPRDHHARETAHLAQSIGLIVQDLAQRFAKVFDDLARQPGADTFYLVREIALERAEVGRTKGLEVLDLELLAVARMVLEAAGGANRRANLQPGQAPDYGDARARAVVIGAFDDRDRVAILIVRKEDLFERPLDSVLRVPSLGRGCVRGGRAAVLAVDVRHDLTTVLSPLSQFGRGLG